MITISLCMIVKNEENTIARCLESVKDVVDEIIIVDTGSNDKTKEITKQFTSKIYDFSWIDDFSAARNFSFSKATKEYILWLDADDILLYEDIEKFKLLKETLESSVDSVTMKYNIGFDEYGNITSSYRRNRLVKRINNFKWIGFVHEYLSVYGNIVNSEVSVTHKKIKCTPNRNLEIYKNKLESGIEFSTRDILYYGNELYDHGIFKEALEFYNKFTALDSIMHSFAYKLTKNVEDSRDLFQETMFRALKNKDKFRAGTNFKAWMLTIMKNIFINDYRKKMKANTIMDSTDNNFYINSGKNTINNQGDSNIMFKELTTMVEELSDDVKVPFVMHYKGYKYQEIAEHLELPLGTVKSRIFFARKELKQKIKSRYNSLEEARAFGFSKN